MKEIFKIVEYPDKKLLEKSEDFIFNDSNKQFLDNFKKTYEHLTNKFGKAVVGLAAPQVGYNLNVFIAFGEVFINPKIIWVPDAPEDIESEGCLSLPLTSIYKVSRPYSLRLRWIDENHNTVERKFNNLNARVIFHEMDHLNGKLCNEYANQHE